jgi:hypothetical protein
MCDKNARVFCTAMSAPEDVVPEAAPEAVVEVPTEETTAAPAEAAGAEVSAKAASKAKAGPQGGLTPAMLDKAVKQIEFYFSDSAREAHGLVERAGSRTLPEPAP